MKKKLIGLLIVLAIGGTIAHAEMRIWTNMEGKTVEAKYMGFLAGKVTLKTPRGKQIIIPANTLSQKDLDYLRTSIPPKITIEVDLDRRGGGSTTTRSTGWSKSTQQAKSVQLCATLTKRTKAPCDQQFTAWLYVFSKNLSGNTSINVADLAVQDFTFGDEDEIELLGKTCRFEVETYKSEWSKSKSGKKCAGYLACIVDSNKKVILVDASSKKYEKKAKEVLGRGKGSKFDSGLNPIGKTKWHRKKKGKKGKGNKQNFTF